MGRGTVARRWRDTSGEVGLTIPQSLRDSSLYVTGAYFGFSPWGEAPPQAVVRGDEGTGLPLIRHLR